jgi:RNA polymerase sigma-70 factor (ECF subfamily)
MTSDAPSSDALEQQLRPLWLAARGGDESAYAQALTLIARRLRGYFARRLAQQPHDEEDLVQETLLAIHLQRASFDASVPVTAWLHAIARHKLVDRYRKLGRRLESHTSIDELDSAFHPAVEDEEQPARRDLIALMKQLPAAQQQAIVLTRIEGLSMAEASARTGVSVAALKVQVHRGLKKLGTLVRDDDAQGV